ncbi:methyl-accepting chemotaxis sensory transducer with Cache sensor [Tistlia consotensis]|uniref:Methyl-accepting chemotaxis sensory transducer with Cache sensor n=1 Tax=Tistlia consotensis USBA 355 TaxID=560819 RepID=A0A1Y6CY84_9PROT|nr:methyl-accepting chemotaxis protein [Tistlia consotensis]SMF82679.1 methyl-accepting chemotaxis sensory transducer with Cache sensor [Tistlia consotensis USBA 355]SNS29825.1 methyl-accepting chemotaxis sensory transducer with Cache sensor [Tistlia consotensis]
MRFSRLTSFGITHRVIALIALTAASMIVLAGIRLVDLKHALVEQKRTELRQLVESATSVAEAYHARAEAGEMTKEAAQQAALKAIGAMRYNGADYFWVNDMTPVMVMHPVKPDLVGKDVSGLRDPAGTALFMEFVKVVKAQGAGFVGYLWPKPGKEQPVPKESFVEGFAPWGWIIGTGVYIDDIEAAFRSKATVEAGQIALILLVIGGISLLVARSITRPITRMSQRMRSLAAGDLDGEVPGMARRDEIGGMAQAVQVFRANAVERQRLEAESRLAAQRAEEEKRRTMQEIASGFEATVQSVVETLSQTAGRMQTTARSMSTAVEETEQQAGAVAAASQEASASVQTVASAAEELSSSIDEIGRQVDRSSHTATRAVEDARLTNEKVSGLVDAARKIGEVVELIQEIAEQTNLLALNATIEAARAGDAGKGFAVVASEVKALANQTAKATEEISQQISHIQGATTDAATAIKGIGQTVETIDEIAASISAAVQEQGAATQEIARNVQQASESTRQVASSISAVSRTATETGGSAGLVLEAADQLAQQSENLRQEVEQFIAQIRAG